MENLSQYLDFTLALCEKAGDELYRAFRSGQPIKRGTSKEVKSVYDNIVDEIIKQAIELEFPTHSYITEETGYVEKDKDFLWVIDPLDGTSNLENHNPFFAVSIALWIKGRPAFGVIEAPALRERFYAVAGQGAYRADLLHGQEAKVQVSAVEEIGKSFFVFCEGGEKNKARVKHIFGELYPQMKDFRKLGSAALELAWVGTGRAEGYITTNISFYDIAAGIIFVQEAGGQVSGFDGVPLDFGAFEPLGHYDLIASNGKIEILLQA